MSKIALNDQVAAICWNYFLSDLLGVDLFKDKTADLRNETLRIATFAHVPGTVKSNQSVSNKIRANIRLSNTTEVFSGMEIEASRKNEFS